MARKKYPFYDFFAGAGLAGEGLGDRWRCVWANDIDPRKQAAYTANYDPKSFVLGDVGSISADSLPTPATLAWASFPCQDLSLAGWRGGMSAGRSGTFWPFWRLLRDLDDQHRRPPLVVLENVLGLLYSGDFVGLCEALAALDLDFGALVVDAARFVPQSRPRVFVVAVDSGVAIDRLGTRSPPASSPWVPKRLLAAFESLPPQLRERWIWWDLPQPGKPSASLEDLVENEPVGVEWLSSREVKRLLSLMSKNNREKVEAARKIRGRHVGFLYKRTRKEGQRAEVRFDGVAGCLRTPRGGSSRQTVLIVENAEVRARLLSPREAARLMGLRDSYVLPNSYNDAYLAMGDAVAVPVVRWLADHLLTPLAEQVNAHGEQAPRERDVLVEHRRSAEARADEWQRGTEATEAAAISLAAQRSR